MAHDVLVVPEPRSGFAKGESPESGTVVLCAVAAPVTAGLATYGKVGNGLIPQNFRLSSCEMLKQFRSAW